MRHIADLLGLPTQPKEEPVVVWKIHRDKFDLDAWRDKIKEHAIENTKLNGGIVAPEIHYYCSHHDKSPEHVVVGLLKVYLFNENPMLAMVVGQTIPPFIAHVKAEAVVIVTGAKSSVVNTNGETNEECLADIQQQIQTGTLDLRECLFLQYETANICELDGFEIVKTEDGFNLIELPSDEMPIEVPHLLFDKPQETT